MAKGTYEYEVMRAELLGIEKPDYDEFVKQQQEKEKKAVEDETLDDENLKAAAEQGDELKGITGKMDELNSLLSLTQKKINNFKVRCSSVTSYMKTRLGNLQQSASVDNTESDSNVCDPPTPKSTPTRENSLREAATSDATRKSDLAKALDGHVDKLDGLLEGAEKAEISMQEQRKTMQKFLK